MTTAKDANLDRLKLVADRLGPLLNRAVFVGGYELDCLGGVVLCDVVHLGLIEEVVEDFVVSH